jgi:hypothetical protein
MRKLYRSVGVVKEESVPVNTHGGFFGALSVKEKEKREEGVRKEGRLEEWRCISLPLLLAGKLLEKEEMEMEK